MNQQHDDDDIDLGTVEECPPLIPAGEYTVGYSRAAKKYKSMGEDRVPVYFKIADAGEHVGKELVMAIRTSPRKGEKSMAYSSKLARAATIALGKSPKRYDRLGVKALFAGRYFRAEVVTVVKDWKRKPLPLENQYSIIDRLVKLVGGPNA